MGTHGNTATASASATNIGPNRDRSLRLILRKASPVAWGGFDAFSHAATVQYPKPVIPCVYPAYTSRRTATCARSTIRDGRRRTRALHTRRLGPERQMHLAHRFRRTPEPPRNPGRFRHARSSNPYQCSHTESRPGGARFPSRAHNRDSAPRAPLDRVMPESRRTEPRRHCVPDRAPIIRLTEYPGTPALGLAGRCRGRRSDA